MTPDQAAAKALVLFSQDASLCHTSTSPCDKRLEVSKGVHCPDSASGGHYCDKTAADRRDAQEAEEEDNDDEDVDKDNKDGGSLNSR